MSSRRHSEIEDLLVRLDLIEEQAQRAIEEFPAEIRKERQRRILELVQEIRDAAAPRAPTGNQARLKLIVP